MAKIEYESDSLKVSKSVDVEYEMKKTEREPPVVCRLFMLGHLFSYNSISVVSFTSNTT